ncbi:hypothetical protein PM708P4_00045 [Parabacteroides phage PM708P4]|nr:hypothetical protein PM682P3_00006 [Parabacteroides phage PM682P3]WAX17717.1 hypothetical protein PM682P4_00005 [Parabacteroides phage PM682P4]WAX17902.1 hypothetical protein PM708P3_00044 [Parabacteroides phage PM708P3]WAX17952.1 hypothetical protein PM708P4_00045 [Parabacteroides phage PM708P4]
MVDKMIEHIETYLRVVVAGAAVTVVKDIQTLLIIVFLLTFFNWLIGLLAGMLKQGEKYSHAKTFKAFREMYTALMILFVTGLVCNLLEPDVDYKILIQGITVIFVIVYAKNISKNLKILQPTNDFVATLDKIVNVRFKKMHKKIDDGVSDISEITKNE